MRITDIYTDMLMTLLPIEMFTVEGLDVKEVWFRENVKSQQYGKIKCVFEKENYTYQLTYNVHTPNQDKSLANHAECIEEVKCVHEVIEEETYEFINIVASSFGKRAFWDYMDIGDLCGDDYELRLLINAITEYSNRYNLLLRLIQTGSTALKDNVLYRESI